jgi:hypothetical protein
MRVRQDNPLSPLLFNLILDPVLQSLKAHEGGLPFGTQKLKILAFVDDLVLAAKDTTEALSMLHTLETVYINAG